jgi:hypothetical protein
VSEQRGADRAREERERESREGLQCRGRLIGGRKKQVRENQHRRRRVDIEVEELDGGANETGKENLPWRVHGVGNTGRRRGGSDISLGHSGR